MDEAQERKLFIEPTRKDNLQASILNERFDSKLQELRNIITREADYVKSGESRLNGWLIFLGITKKIKTYAARTAKLR